MTTGETLVIVLMVLAGTVGPWIWIIYGLIRASDETFEPAYQPRTYHTSARYFFFSIDFVMVPFLVAFGVYLMALLSNPPTISDSTPAWIFYVLLVLMVMQCFGISTYILTMYANYWKYTKDRVLTFDPVARTLTVQTDEDEYVLSENDIERVDIFSNEGYRFIYSYFRFTLRDGRALIITDKTKGAYAIFEFFKHLPTHRHRHWLPAVP